MVQTRVAPTPTMRRGANFCNASGTVEQVNHYYPFGGLFGQSTNGDTQRYKYNGKEFDRMHGLDWYDYGARHMDAMRFTTMDPLAEKYYNMSPYAYCANNPINSIDPNGNEIWIYYNDDNGSTTSFQYYAGMDCKVKDEAVRTIVSNLNKMYQNKAGAKVLDAIIGSPTKYGFMQAETHSMNGEGYYDPSTNVSYINDVSNTLTLAEEAFHMYQYVNNQGGPTAVNEVEAKLFSAKMNYEIDDWFSQLRYQNKLAGIGDSPYSKSMESLFYKSYSDEDFKIAVDNFFTGSIGGVVYKNKPGYKRGSIKRNPLIKEFLPAK